MKHFASYLINILVLITGSLLPASCNLEDFNTSKLTKVEDIIPVFFAPLANGTYKVSELTPSLPDLPVPASGFDLEPIVVTKPGTTLSSKIDSVYLVTTFTNNTLCDMVYDLNFTEAPSGAIVKQLASATKIPAGAKDFQVKFGLGTDDLKTLQSPVNIELKLKLLPPPAVNLNFKELTGSMFTIKIYFYAPVNFFKS